MKQVIVALVLLSFIPTVAVGQKKYERPKVLEPSVYRGDQTQAAHRSSRQHHRNRLGSNRVLLDEEHSTKPIRARLELRKIQRSAATPSVAIAE